MIKQLIKSLLKNIKKKELIPIPQIINAEQVLDGRVALITGGSGGIGFAIAKAFVESGCKVIISGTNETKLKKCCSDLGGDKSQYILCDFLESSNNYDEIIKQAELLFNKSDIDILVNSAGIMTDYSFLDITENDYDRIMNINVKGVFFLSQAMSKYMIKKKIKGNILNISSSSALRPAWTPYQMSKWAIRGFTMGLADSLVSNGIVVNAIAPGPTATSGMGKLEGDSIWLGSSPSGRFVMPSEIASLAVFMVSDMGRMIVGDTFYITGGSGTISYHR